MSSCAPVSNQDQVVLNRILIERGFSKVAVMQMNVFVEQGMMPSAAPQGRKTFLSSLLELFGPWRLGLFRETTSYAFIEDGCCSLMRYKASRFSSLNTCTVPQAPSLNHAPMPRDKRHRLSRRSRSRQLGAFFSRLFGVYLQDFRSRRDGDLMGLTSNRSRQLAPVLS